MKKKKWFVRVCVVLVNEFDLGYDKKKKLIKLSEVYNKKYKEEFIEYLYSLLYVEFEDNNFKGEFGYEEFYGYVSYLKENVR